MSAPDPVLIDLIAAHQLDHYDGSCTGRDWDYTKVTDTPPGSDPALEKMHAQHVAELYAGGQTAHIAELREWQIKVAQGLGMCEGVIGVGYAIADVTEAAERAENLTTLELEHIECPVWCHDCERVEQSNSCAHCNGSGCGPGTASGAYDPCDWCAGDGREHGPNPQARIAELEAENARLQEQVARDKPTEPSEFVGFGGCTDRNPDICACGQDYDDECSICGEVMEGGEMFQMLTRIGRPGIPDHHRDQEWENHIWHADCATRAEAEAEAQSAANEPVAGDVPF